MSIAHASRRYQRVLDYLPDDVVLEAAAQDLELEDAQACLCGWALRATLAKVTKRAITKVDPDMELEGYSETVMEYYNVPEHLAAIVGGKVSVWDDLFMGVLDGNPQKPLIEYAWVRRVNDAVQRMKRKRGGLYAYAGR